MVTKENFLIDITCPVCGTSDRIVQYPVSHKYSTVLKLLGFDDSNDILVDIVSCNECNHHYMTPVISDEHMIRYYSILNSEFYHNSGLHNANHNAEEYQNYCNAIKKLKPFGKVLEVGCGNGYLLKKLEENGYDCFGVEPSPMAYSYAKNSLGLSVENCFLTKSNFYNEKFDVVILIDVVEHINKMQSFMNEITSVLNEGGIIFIGTGNIKSLNAKIAGPNWGYFLSWEHVSFFTKKSMTYLLEYNNFTNIQIKETSLQHKPLQNLIEFIKNLVKKAINPVLNSKYYHGICYDHFIVSAIYKKGERLCHDK